MNTKATGAIIIIISAFLMLFVFYFLFLNDKKIVGDEFQNTEENNSAKTTFEGLPDSTQIQKTQETNDNAVAEERVAKKKNEINEEDLMRMAASFAERFGSYSNQSNFSNITDLDIFMSRNMQKWAEDFVKDQRKRMVPNDIYYGIVTKAVFEEVKVFDDDVGQAEIIVTTRRREATMSMDNISNSFDQDIAITFIKENKIWKVNNAYWKDK